MLHNSKYYTMFVNFYSEDHLSSPFSLIYYGIIFCGNSSQSSLNFKMHKRVIRIIMGYGYRELCRELFRELKILTLFITVFVVLL
jgi:hypothetical protein